ncbi:MAG: carboxyltransferase domain-containing protein, partial [Actinobacteria bacterium]|nr:carboxyltransferase domain-containing protein [Actinomycetota bacterium]
MSGPAVTRQAGDRAVLVELEDNDAVHRLAGALEGRRGSELEEIVPGHETLLLVWSGPAPAHGAVAEMVAAAEEEAAAAAPQRQ